MASADSVRNYLCFVLLDLATVEPRAGAGAPRRRRGPVLAEDLGIALIAFLAKAGRRSSTLSASASGSPNSQARVREDRDRRGLGGGLGELMGAVPTRLRPGRLPSSPPPRARRLHDRGRSRHRAAPLPCRCRKKTHAAGRVAPLEGIGDLRVDDYRVYLGEVLATPRRRAPWLVDDRLRAAIESRAGAFEVVGDAAFLDDRGRRGRGDPRREPARGR